MSGYTLLHPGDAVVLIEHDAGDDLSDVAPDASGDVGAVAAADASRVDAATSMTVWYLVVRGHSGRETPVRRNEGIEFHNLTSSVVLQAKFRSPPFLHQVFVRSGDVVALTASSPGRNVGEDRSPVATAIVRRLRVPCVPHLFCPFGAAQFVEEASSSVVDAASLRRFWTGTRCCRPDSARARDVGLATASRAVDVGVDELRMFLTSPSCLRRAGRPGRVLIVSQHPDSALRIWEQTLSQFGERACAIPMLGYESRFVGRGDVRVLAPRFLTYQTILLDVPPLFEASAKAYVCRYWGGCSESEAYGTPAASAMMTRLLEDVDGHAKRTRSTAARVERSAAQRAETIVGSVSASATPATSVRVAFALAELAAELLACAAS